MSRRRQEVDRALTLELAQKGASNTEMAKANGMALRTFQKRLAEDVELCNSVLAGKREHDSEVELSLANKAKGFVGPDGKYYPPDTVACIFWLKNRQPDRWKDKQDINHGGSVTVEIVKFENPPA